MTVRNIKTIANFFLISLIYVSLLNVSPSLTLTSLVGVTQQRLLLRSEPRRGSVLHPGGDGELVREILRYHPVGDLSRLMTVEPEDQIAVPPAVRHQGSRPVGGGAGGRQEVSAARRGPCENK